MGRLPTRGGGWVRVDDRGSTRVEGRAKKGCRGGVGLWEDAV